MALTTSQITKLNNSMRAAQDVSMGTILNNADTLNDVLATGTHTVTAGEATADAATIDVGKTINYFIVQVYRSDILLGSYDVSASGTELTIATNGTDYDVTEDDVINYITF